jgi:hypothetical protein
MSYLNQQYNSQKEPYTFNRYYQMPETPYFAIHTCTIHLVEKKANNKRRSRTQYSIYQIDTMSAILVKSQKSLH